MIVAVKNRREKRKNMYLSVDMNYILKISRKQREFLIFTFALVVLNSSFQLREFNRNAKK